MLGFPRTQAQEVAGQEYLEAALLSLKCLLGPGIRQLTSQMAEVKSDMIRIARDTQETVRLIQAGASCIVMECVGCTYRFGSESILPATR